MDRELAPLFKQIPHGGAKQLMLAALILPSCQVAI
jgi:hypothetical protein